MISSLTIELEDRLEHKFLNLLESKSYRYMVKEMSKNRIIKGLKVLVFSRTIQIYMGF